MQAEPGTWQPCWHQPLLQMFSRARASHIRSLLATRSLASMRVKCFTRNLSHFSLRLLAWLSVSGFGDVRTLPVGQPMDRPPEACVVLNAVHL